MSHKKKKKKNTNNNNNNNNNTTTTNNNTTTLTLDLEVLSSNPFLDVPFRKFFSKFSRRDGTSCLALCFCRMVQILVEYQILHIF
jgi:hypothetical protein